MKKNIWLSIFSILILLPAIAGACPLCQGGASEKTAIAYKGITLFLALMPIIGGGGIFYWIYCKNKTQENEKMQ